MPRSKSPKPTWTKWTVEFEVIDPWIEDQFELDNETAMFMLENRLPYAYEYELKALVIKRTPCIDPYAHQKLEHSR